MADKKQTKKSKQRPSGSMADQLKEVKVSDDAKKDAATPAADAKADPKKSAKAQTAKKATKAQTAKKTAEKAAPKPEPEPEKVQEAQNGAADESAAAEAEAKVEEAEPESAQNENVPPPYVMTLPKERCFVCTHLLVSMPKEVSAGGKAKKTRSAAFGCHDDPVCPAQRIKVVFDPFTPQVVKRAVDAWAESGDLTPVHDLYAQADGTSAEVRDKFHGMVREMMAKAAVTEA